MFSQYVVSFLTPMPCELLREALTNSPLDKSPNDKNWKVNVFAFPACSGSLGMQSGKIKDSQLTASSKWGNALYWAVVNGRLNSGRFWARNTGYGQWLQIAFERETVVTKVATQGSVAHEKWVRDYKISSSKDAFTWNFIVESGANKVCRVTHWIRVNRKIYSIRVRERCERKG